MHCDPSVAGSRKTLAEGAGAAAIAAVLNPQITAHGKRVRAGLRWQHRRHFALPHHRGGFWVKDGRLVRLPRSSA